jgi:hypothetical protein
LKKPDPGLIVSNTNLIQIIASHSFKSNYIQFKNLSESMNWTNVMQEFLQRLAPHLGCQCQNLWRFQESRLGSFKVQVLLLNTTQESLPLGWSEPFLRIKDARQDAARIALEWLQENHQNLVFKNGFLVLSSQKPSSGIFQKPLHSIDSDIKVIKNYTNKFCFSDIYATVAPKRKESALIDRDSFSDSDSESNNFDIFEDYFTPKKLFQSSFSLNSPSSLFQQNPGRIGEEYATRWIHHVTGSCNSTIIWLNKEVESGQPYDIMYTGGHPSIPLFIEVKCNWANRKCHPSERQLDELFTNHQYGLLHIRNMKAMFDENLPLPPTVVLYRLPSSYFETVKSQPESLEVTAPPEEEIMSTAPPEEEVMSTPMAPPEEEVNPIPQLKRVSLHRYRSLPIRHEAIPILIGRQGRNIKRIQEASNCLIRVRSFSDDSVSPASSSYQVEITAPGDRELTSCTQLVTVEISFIDLDCAIADLRKIYGPYSGYSLGAIKVELEYSLNCGIQLIRAERECRRITVRFRSEASDPLSTNLLIRDELLEKLSCCGLSFHARDSHRVVRRTPILSVIGTVD